MMSEIAASSEMLLSQAEPEFPALPPLIALTWRYDMRRQMQEIIPNLFLGPYACATRSNFAHLKEEGFTHIVCVRQCVERHLIRPNFPESFKYLVIEMADDCYERIIPHCKVVCEFLQNCLDSGGKALVHGNGGACRSAALVIAFVMFRYGIPAHEAQRYVQSRRFCINPNDNFVAQLREFEPIYRAYRSVPDSEHSGGGGCVKRPREMLDMESNSLPTLVSSHNYSGSSALTEEENMSE